MQPKRPAVTLTLTQSLDGYHLHANQRVYMHEALSRADWKRREFLHAVADAVLVSGELLVDAPLTDVALYLDLADDLRGQRRADERPEMPLVGIVISNAAPLVHSPALTHFIQTGTRTHPEHFWLYTTEQTPAAAISELEQLGLRVRVFGACTVDLHRVLADLGSEGIEVAVIEGDADLTTRLLAEGLVDELAVFIAPILLGTLATPILLGALAAPVALELTLVRDEGHALIASYRVAHTHSTDVPAWSELTAQRQSVRSDSVANGQQGDPA